MPPVAATNKMSTYCKGTADPTKRSGPEACPFNVLYWDFMARHQERFRSHPRMALMIRQLDRIDTSELEAIVTARGLDGLNPAA